MRPGVLAGAHGGLRGGAAVRVQPQRGEVSAVLPLGQGATDRDEGDRAGQGGSIACDRARSQRPAGHRFGPRAAVAGRSSGAYATALLPRAALRQRASCAHPGARRSAPARHTPAGCAHTPTRQHGQRPREREHVLSAGAVRSRRLPDRGVRIGRQGGRRPLRRAQRRLSSLRDSVPGGRPLPRLLLHLGRHHSQPLPAQYVPHHDTRG
mmetsp:Transcript_17901/g.39686  ORF Transcript_17901/g.39686 Transcript_17901/m.39686 type:complete len:209 (+) Transcript_17901:1185-1811(+)